MVQLFEEINIALDKCCDLALQQPLPNKQIALMTDASFAAAGYAVLIETVPTRNLPHFGNRMHRSPMVPKPSLQPK